MPPPDLRTIRADAHHGHCDTIRCPCGRGLRPCPCGAVHFTQFVPHSLRCVQRPHKGPGHAAPDQAHHAAITKRENLNA